MELCINHEKIKRVYTFLGIFLILLLITIFQEVDGDTVWAYGFSYNISKGLILYKDFNMVLGPFYSLFFSIPMLLFGNYLIAYKIFYLILYSFILVYVFEKIGYKIILLKDF